MDIIKEIGGAFIAGMIGISFIGFFNLILSAVSAY